MKIKLLVFTLIIAVLFDIAGLVFFILFLNNEGKMRGMKKYRDNMSSQMQYLRNTQAYSGNTDAGAPQRVDFISQLDGKKDEYVVSAPGLADGMQDLTLFVYLHGMGSPPMEPYLVPKEKPIAAALLERYPHSAFASLNYRGNSSWLNDQAIADVNQNIRELLQRYPAKKIVLLGTSMGACSVLAYSYLAPEDISQLIAGVVACEGAGDLIKLYKETPSHIVKSGFVQAFGAPPDVNPLAYQKRSLLLNLDQVKSNRRYAILSATRDSVIPAKFQAALIQGLSERGIQSKLVEFPDQHGIPEATYYLQGTNFVLGN